MFSPGNVLSWATFAPLAGAGRGLRHLQTGRVQTYLYGALGGALAVVLLNFLLR